MFTPHLRACSLMSHTQRSHKVGMLAQNILQSLRGFDVCASIEVSIASLFCPSSDESRLHDGGTPTVVKGFREEGDVYSARERVISKRRNKPPFVTSQSRVLRMNCFVCCQERWSWCLNTWWRARLISTSFHPWGFSFRQSNVNIRPPSFTKYVYVYVYGISQRYRGS